MVFIAIAAVKAAKAARHEYKKDKKRNEIINPVEGSATLMNQRQNPQQQGTQHWWSDPNANSSNTSIPSQQHQSQHALGAWSRDSTIQEQQAQLNDQRQKESQRPTSTPLLPNTSDQQHINSVPSSSPRPVSTPNFPPYNQTSSHSSSSDLQFPRDIERPSKPVQLQNQSIKIKSNNSTSSSSRTASKSPPPQSNASSQTRPKPTQEQEKVQKQQSKQPTDGSFDSVLLSGTLPPSTPVPRVGEQQTQPTILNTKSAFNIAANTQKRITGEQSQPTLTTVTSAFGIAGETRKRTGTINSTSNITNATSAMPMKMGSKRTIAPIPKTNNSVSIASEDNLTSAFKNPGTMKKKVKQPAINPTGSSVLLQTEQNTQHKVSPTSVSTQSSMSAAGTMKKRRGTRPTNQD